MNKVCTSIEQTKKLIDLGIDINTADLTVLDLPVQDGDRFKFISSKLPNDTFPSITDGKSERIPAWSLTALLGLIPKFSLEKDVSGNEGYQLHYNYNTVYYDDPIDAAFDMICWLKEHNKI